MRKLVFLCALLCTTIAYCEGSFQAGQEKSSVCAACHGARGISDNPEWPNLAGQHASYLTKQLRDYQSGTRRYSAVMSPLAAALSTQDIEDLAEYYAKLPPAKGVSAQQALTRGERLYRGGDYRHHITACIACHGPKGTGNAQAGFPVISGQHPAYTIQQMTLFKEKKRQNDLNAIMREISAHMPPEEIAAVANYLAGLH